MYRYIQLGLQTTKISLSFFFTEHFRCDIIISDTFTALRSSSVYNKCPMILSKIQRIHCSSKPTVMKMESPKHAQPFSAPTKNYPCVYCVALSGVRHAYAIALEFFPIFNLFSSQGLKTWLFSRFSALDFCDNCAI